MALITCPECKGSVSDTLDSCPHCGHKIKLAQVDIKHEKKTDTIGLLSLLCILIIIIYAIFFCSSPSPKTETSDSSSPASSNVNNNVSTSAQENIPPLDKYVGQHPREIFKEPAVASKFQSLLVDTDSYDIFMPRIDVSDGVELKNDFYVGAGCLLHACGTDEAAFAINRQTGEAYAIMIVDGKQITWYGVKDAATLPAPLLKWLNEHYNPSVVAAGGSADLIWKTPENAREMQKWRHVAARAGVNADEIVKDIKYMTYAGASPIPGKFNYWLLTMGISLHKEPFPEGITWQTIGPPKVTGKNIKLIWIQIRDPHFPAYYMRSLEEADCAKGLKKTHQINTYINDGTLVKSWKADKPHYKELQGKKNKIDSWLSVDGLETAKDIYNAICQASENSKEAIIPKQKAPQ